MTSTEKVIYTPEYWVSWFSASLIGILIHALILFKEIRNRRSSITKFTTKRLKILSISCIINGLIARIFFFTDYLYPFCIFSYVIGWIFYDLQFLSMGYYQLSRLYYCFANDQIHSNKGYPKWLFYIMYTSGIVFAVNMQFMLMSNVEHHRICGINNKYEFTITF